MWDLDEEVGGAWQCQCQPRQQDTPNATERYDLLQLFNVSRKHFRWQVALRNPHVPHWMYSHHYSQRAEEFERDYEAAKRNLNLTRIQRSNIIGRFGKRGSNIMNTRNF